MLTVQGQQGNRWQQGYAEGYLGSCGETSREGAGLITLYLLSSSGNCFGSAKGALFLAASVGMWALVISRAFLLLISARPCDALLLGYSLPASSVCLGLPC